MNRRWRIQQARIQEQLGDAWMGQEVKRLLALPEDDPERMAFEKRYVEVAIQQENEQRERENAALLDAMAAALAKQDSL